MSDVKAERFYETKDGETVRCSGPTTDGKWLRVWGADSQEGWDVKPRDLVREVPDPSRR